MDARTHTHTTHAMRAASQVGGVNSDKYKSAVDKCYSKVRAPATGLIGLLGLIGPIGALG
jgi:hypothetical protein